MSSPKIISGADPSAKFLAQLTRGGTILTEGLRALGCDLPVEPEALGKLWEDTRPGRRAVNAAGKRSCAPKREARELTPKQERDAAVERRRDRQYREKFEKRAQGWTRAPDEKGRIYRNVEDDLWRTCKELRSNTSGAAWRYHAGKVRNKAALGATWRAAFGPYADSPEHTRRGFADDRARALLTLGYALTVLAKHPSRSGSGEKIVKGIPVECLQWLLAYPDGSNRPHRNTLTGRHRGPDSRPDGGDLGYLRALEQAGLIVSARQWYHDPADWELGPERDVVIRGVACKVAFPMNRYWVVGQTPPRYGNRREDVIALIREGWEALQALPRRWRPKRPGRPGPRAPVHGETAENTVHSPTGPPLD